MRRIFTFSVIAAACLFTGHPSGAQCTSGSFTAVTTNTFISGPEGFTGDFTWANSGGGQLVSTDISAGTSKSLTSTTYFQPASQPTVSFGYDLGGSANVTAYSVDILYLQGGSIVSTNVCSGGSLSKGNNLNFSVTAPAQILGQRFQIRITYTVSGTSNQGITIDNFRSTGQTSNIILPVRFSTFDARTMSSAVSLEWAVGVEDNISGYEVEKSPDGRNFSRIGFVAAAGLDKYSFSDTRPSSISYYRIKSMDISGRYTYSTVVLVKAGKSLTILKAFPTPFVRTVALQHGTASAGSLITVSSEDGRMIRSIVPATGTQQTEIDLSSERAGLYLVHYSDGTGAVQTLKIVKQQ